MHIHLLAKLDENFFTALKSLFSMKLQPTDLGKVRLPAPPTLAHLRIILCVVCLIPAATDVYKGQVVVSPVSRHYDEIR